MRERPFLKTWWPWATLLGLLWAGPYVVAWRQQGDAWVFTGFLFAVEDGNSYIAKMLLGYHGAWRFTSPHTVEPQRGYWIFGPYLLLGKLAWGPDVHARLVVLFHLFRLVAGGLLAWALWAFLGLFTRGRGRWVAWFMALLGGGLGWVPWLWRPEHLPLSWYSPEGFGFLMPWGLPHLALARALSLLLLTRLLRLYPDVRQGKTALPWKSLLALPLLLGWVHGFQLVSLTMLSGGLLLWGFLREGLRGKSRFRLERATHLLGPLLVALAATPWLLYLVYLAYNDSFIRTWIAQDVLPTPAWPTLAWAYLWVLPWAWWGWQHLRRTRPTLAFFTGWWVVTALTLAHIPHPLQRRFLEGLWVALSALVGTALDTSRTPSRLLPLGARSHLVLPALAGISPLLFGLALLQRAQRPALPVFRPREEIVAFQALARMARPGDAVLAAYATGNPLTAWAPVRVPLGLGPESIHADTWSRRVRRFFQASTSYAWRQELLRTWRFRFVFYGPAERALGTWDPGTAPYLHLRFRRGGYAIYEVVAP